ncbi:hypothetical protein, partial [Alistipes finegoldii]
NNLVADYSNYSSIILANPASNSRMAYHLELYHPILPAGVGSTCSHRCADRCSVLIVSLKIITMKNGWDSNRWDEDWDEPYKTPEERLRDHAARSMDEDPLLGYGLGPYQDNIQEAATDEEIEFSRERRISRGRYRRSTYKVFTKEEARNLGLIK